MCVHQVFDRFTAGKRCNEFSQLSYGRIRVLLGTFEKAVMALKLILYVLDTRMIWDMQRWHHSSICASLFIIVHV